MYVECATCFVQEPKDVFISHVTAVVGRHILSRARVCVHPADVFRALPTTYVAPVRSHARLHAF